MPKIEMEKDKQTKQALNKMGQRIVQQIEEEKNPSIERPVRSKSNVEFDKEDGTLYLGDNRSSRKLLNISHARKFMQTILVANKCKDLISQSRTASIRELYYQLKHQIPGLDENTLEEQSDSDPLIVDIETVTGALRESLHLKADPKGVLFGPIKIRDQGDVIDGMSMGKSGMAVPSIVDDYEFVETSAEYILVVETAALVDRLVEEDFHRKEDAILVGSKGQPARGVRRLVHIMHDRLDLPVYVFTDGDPWGYYIFSVLKAGSMSLAFQSDRLATPDADLVGMTMEDVNNYDLHKVTEKLKGKPKSDPGGPTADFKRIRDMMDYPWFQNEQWQAELEKMLEMKVRIEQQALASKALQFVADEYLPEKIATGDILP